MTVAATREVASGAVAFYEETLKTPWTVPDVGWRICQVNGCPNYWLWSDRDEHSTPEEFLFYVRCVLPNAGHFETTQTNHGVIWCALPGETIALGLRFIPRYGRWILAMLDKKGSARDALACAGVKILAEEFLRNTEPRDLFTCARHIVEECRDWWSYLLVVERKLNWKLKEVQNFTACLAAMDGAAEIPRVAVPTRRGGHRPSQSSGPLPIRPPSVASSHFRAAPAGRDRSPRVRTKQEHDPPARSKSPVPRLRGSVSPPRGSSTWGAADYSISPPRSEIPAADRRTGPSDVQMTKPLAPLNGFACQRCNLTFTQSYELMAHYTSAAHIAALERSFAK